MNLSMTPQPIHLVDQYDDGDHSRHYTFQLAQPTSEQIQPGQFFTLTLAGFGEAAFTYLTAPDEQGRFQALIRRAGVLTSQLFKTETGTLLGYRGPFGSGLWPIEEIKEKRVLLIAGGIGLPPLATAIEALLANGSDVGLIYGSRDYAGQVLKQERERWQQQMPMIETFDQAVGDQLSGTPLDHLDAINQQLGGEVEAVLTCGPEVMMQAVGRSFTDRWQSTDNIWLALERRMHCGIGLCGHCYLGSSYVCTDGPVYRWREFLKQQKVM
ncbi:MAG: FAD/NAD(P)-binding protein [Candidatus Polarisedimenticolaceae bacterium]|nr:FAD/NAD(P)-binding protein [Candidatus Polarisedimenticolaceae bacterium]